MNTFDPKQFVAKERAKALAAYKAEEARKKAEENVKQKQLMDMDAIGTFETCSAMSEHGLIKKSKNKFSIGRGIFLVMLFLSLVWLYNPMIAEAAGGIVAGPAMRLAGSQTFTAVPSGAGGTIQWTVDRLTRTEIDLAGSFTRTSSVYTASGTSATFNLSYTSGNETKYEIKASDAGFNQTVTVQVFPADTRASFMYESTGNPRVPVYVIVPSTLSSATHLVSIHHGVDRNAVSYIDYWATWVAAHNYIAIAPHFSDTDWPDSRSYAEGNMFTGIDGAGTKNPESKWSFTIARDVIIKVLADFGLQDTQADAFGHSAGGQFTQRLSVFRPDIPVRYMMPANPGWWTTCETDVEYPYGLHHSLLSYTQQDAINYTNKSMIIFRGTADVIRDSDLRTTSEADAQGMNRYERAGYAYNKGVALNPNTLWELHDVVGVGHSGRLMSVPAQAFLEAHPRPGDTYTLTIISAGTGTGTVISNPSGISCGITCTASYDAGTSMILTASAANGSLFSGWTGACAGTSTTCNVSMDNSKMITATFSTKNTPTHISSDDGGGCFIATAAFNSPLAGQVEILRQFRDRYLLTNTLGQKFVAWYYRNGPVAANWIKDKSLAKIAVQAALYPLIGFSLLLISGYLPFVMIGLLLSTLLFLRFRPKKLISK